MTSSENVVICLLAIDLVSAPFRGNEHTTSSENVVNSSIYACLCVFSVMVTGILVS